MKGYSNLKEMGIAAKQATFAMASAPTEQKNRFLSLLATGLEHNQECILEANNQDIAEARLHGLSETLIDRLSLHQRLAGIITDVRQVISLPDPVGEKFDQQIMANGLEVVKCRTPIGVLGVIYESRPNVTIDITALTIKSGNCAILRGGSETMHTNKTLLKVIQEALFQAELPREAIQMVPSSERSYVKELLHLHHYIDLIIPRGSAALHSFCRENSQIPVITGGIGICHIFVDNQVDQEKALSVIHNAKTQRPTVCNALDTLLVDSRIATQFIPKVIDTLQPSGVTFRLDSLAWEMLQGKPPASCQLATLEDWQTEWLSLILGIKVVAGVEEAIDHIRSYSTGHSDGILTDNAGHAELFVRLVDSAAVYVNASTRFTDGSQMGLGAEVAISTQKLHARGPMGLKELTSYKWVVHGTYQSRK